jgi:hypothetical protein
MSKDGGLPPLAQKIRSTTWFPVLVDEILMAILSSPEDSFGFKARPKLEAGIVALLAGLSLGRRNPNAIATSFALDPLWTATVGRAFGQRELSRLMGVLATSGREPLRRALLASAMDGQTELQIDLDSSLWELFGQQEGKAYNGHYHGSGYHVGWGVDVRTDRIVTVWLNEGNEHTSLGQDEQLTWILDQGVKVSLARFDAGLIGPKLLRAMEGRVDAFVCRIRPNATLRSLSDPLEPGGPYYAGARTYGEIRYAADSWDKEQRVVVKFQVPEEEKVRKVQKKARMQKAQEQRAPALFAERFYFVTTLAGAPAEVVRTYQQRGESERIFGEFAQTFEPTFRHTEMAKNEVWALLVALSHNVLSSVREALPPVETPQEIRVEHRPAYLPEGWVLGFRQTLPEEPPMRPVRPLLARVRDMALRVPCAFLKIGQRLRLIVCPDLLEPAWFPALMRA